MRLTIITLTAIVCVLALAALALIPLAPSFAEQPVPDGGGYIVIDAEKAAMCRAEGGCAVIGLETGQKAVAAIQHLMRLTDALAKENKRLKEEADRCTGSQV